MEPAPGQRLRLRSLGWGIGDQALSSVTNFILNVAAARSLPPAAFGAFTLAFFSYLIALGVSRAVGSEPLTVHFSNATPARLRRAISDASGSALVVGLVFGLAMILIGLSQVGPSRQAFIGIGLFLPGLLVQDLWRFAFFSKDTSRNAFNNDLVWAAALVPVAGWLMAGDRGSALLYAVAWGSSGTLAALAGVAQLRLLPDPRRIWKWWQQERPLAVRYLGEFAALSGGGQASTYVIGATAGLRVVGNFRASSILLGPLNVLFMGVSAVAVPHAVRIARGSSEDLRRFATVMSIGLCVAPLIWALAILAAPTAWGTALLRGNWSGARRFLLPAALSMASSGAAAGAATALRGLAAARSSLKARLLAALVVVAVVLIGGLAAGGLGAVWGLALGSWFAALLWWLHFSAALTEAGSHQGLKG